MSLAAKRRHEMTQNNEITVGFACYIRKLPNINLCHSFRKQVRWASLILQRHLTQWNTSRWGRSCRRALQLDWHLMVLTYANTRWESHVYHNNWGLLQYMTPVWTPWTQTLKNQHPQHPVYYTNPMVLTFNTKPNRTDLLFAKFQNNWNPGKVTVGTQGFANFES